MMSLVRPLKIKLGRESMSENKVGVGREGILAEFKVYYKSVIE